MEQKRQQQIKPMTPEQIENEAAFAEKIFRELKSEDPGRARKIIKRRGRSKAASLTGQKANILKPEAER